MYYVHCYMKIQINQQEELEIFCKIKKKQKKVYANKKKIIENIKLKNAEQFYSKNL